MTTYDNTNRGVLFDNDRKESDKQPDMNGKLNVNGVDHWFSGWWKESKDGKEFLSLSIGKAVEGASAAPASRQETAPVRRGNRPSTQAPAAAPLKQASGFDDMDDEIPF